MVMERPFSPQSVGREFVRQYYTLLNESPAHLYRFYNHNSSFIHCGIDPPNLPVVGQKDIHQQIQQLNFQDCRTKIKRVDSQATLGNGVVVQVFGKLSNAGQRMRKFTQTFVLAAQSPKKYYVHNDIFRYQDDDSEEEISRSEVEEQEEEHPQPTESRQPEATPQGGYYNAINPVMNGNVEPKIEEPPMMMNQVAPAPVETHQVSSPSNMNSMEIIQSPPMAPQETVQPTAPPQPSVPVNPPSQFIEEPPIVKPQETQEHQFHNQQPPSAPQHNSHQIENETTKTYAGLVKARNNFIGPPYYNNNNSVPVHQSAPKPLSPPGLVKNEYMNNKNSYSRSPNEMPKSEPKPQRNFDQGPRNNFPSGPRTPLNHEDNNGPMGGNDTSRRRSYASDSHQLFIGNLPHTATEQELRELFEKFGQIQDLKICNKGPGKGGAGVRVPNYGFVVFEDKASACAALNSRPILLPVENAEQPVTLNVEEKKRRSEGGGGGRGGPRGGMRGGMGGPPRGRGGGPGGPPGGGMRFNNNPNNANNTNNNNNINNRR